MFYVLHSDGAVQVVIENDQATYGRWKETQAALEGEAWESTAQGLLHTGGCLRQCRDSLDLGAASSLAHVENTPLAAALFEGWVSTAYGLSRLVQIWKTMEKAHAVLWQTERS